MEVIMSIQRNSLNKVMIIGRLGTKPRLRQTNTGVAVVSLSVATNEIWRTEDGEKKLTQWHTVIFWRNLAELASQYLRKGSLIYVEGRLRTRNWQGSDGNKRWTTEIIAARLQFCSDDDRLGCRTGTLQR